MDDWTPVLEFAKNADSIVVWILVAWIMFRGQAERALQHLLASATKDLAESIASLDASLAKLAGRIEAIEDDISDLRERPGKCPSHPSE